jgi:hypothetical protein
MIMAAKKNIRMPYEYAFPKLISSFKTSLWYNRVKYDMQKIVTKIEMIDITL